MDQPTRYFRCTRNTSPPERSSDVRVLVCTVVHHPTDARIFRREIGALRDAGIDVTAIAPWGSDVDSTSEYRKVPIPRAHGWRRFAALRAARARIRGLAADHQVLIVHDPELLLVLPWADLRRLRVRVIWDVHEDLAAALAMKQYLPKPLRSALVPLVRGLERWVESRADLILAESAYQQRFRNTHPVVLNLPLVPSALPNPSRKRQVIYVGSITRARGLDTMLNMAPHLAKAGVTLRLIGEAPSADDAARIRANEHVAWDGALPNADAMREVESSLVGLALLADQPNYRHSMPTKILEYMASGTAVVTTPLPLSRDVVGDDGIVLSSFDTDAVEVAARVLQLVDDDDRRRRYVESAYARVRDHYNWHIAQRDFVTFVNRL